VATAVITSGAPITPSRDTPISTQVMTVATASISALVGSSPRLAWYSPRIGTKACENAPSPKMRRSRLGMRKATLNASVISDAPKARAIRISRTRPVMRESIVRLLMVASALSRFKVRVGAGRWIGAGAPHAGDASETRSGR
jgi:hypothetical protein